MMCLLEEVKVRKVGRGCNMVAHELAQLARLNSCAAWRFDAPLSIKNLVTDDTVISLVKL